jgi:hypothetical protein
MIDRHHGRIVIVCDACGCRSEGDSNECAKVWLQAKRQGWQTRKIDKNWCQFCGEVCASKLADDQMSMRLRRGRVSPSVSYDTDARLVRGRVRGMTFQLRRRAPVPPKHRVIPLECTECRARYIAVLADDPPDWKPHCIECDTPFGPVRGRAVYSLFAEID